MPVHWPPEPLRPPVRRWTCGQRLRVPHNLTAATTTTEAVNSCATKTGQLDALATGVDVGAPLAATACFANAWPSDKVCAEERNSVAGRRGVSGMFRGSIV